MPTTRPRAVAQRTTGVARVQRRVGLDHVVDQARDATVPGRDRPAEPADDAGGDRSGQTPSGCRPPPRAARSAACRRRRGRPTARPSNGPARRPGRPADRRRRRRTRPPYRRRTWPRPRSLRATTCALVRRNPSDVKTTRRSGALAPRTAHRSAATDGRSRAATPVTTWLYASSGSSVAGTFTSLIRAETSPRVRLIPLAFRQSRTARRCSAFDRPSRVHVSPPYRASDRRPIAHSVRLCNQAVAYGNGPTLSRVRPREGHLDKVNGPPAPTEKHRINPSVTVRHSAAYQPRRDLPSRSSHLVATAGRVPVDRASHTLSTAMSRPFLLTSPGPPTPTLPAEAAPHPASAARKPPSRPLDARRRHCLRRRNTPPARRDLPERARQAGVRGISVPPRTTQPRTPALPMGHQLSCCRLACPPRGPRFVASIIYSGETSTW